MRPVWFECFEYRSIQECRIGLIHLRFSLEETTPAKQTHWRRLRDY